MHQLAATGRRWVLGMPALGLAFRPLSPRRAMAQPGLAHRLHAASDPLFSALAEAGGNAAISPLNLLDALAPMLLAARGEARAALATLLAGASGTADPIADPVAPEGGGSEASLSRAAALWLDSAGPPLRAEVAAQLQASRHIAVERLAFAEADALARINGWTAGRTRGVVPRILDELPRDAAAIITAALHFTARWAVPFDPARTRQATFRRVGAPTVEVPVMRAGPLQAGWAEADGLLAIRLPYSVSDFAFLALAAPEGADPRRVPELVRQGGVLARLAAMSFETRAVEVALPRLSVAGGGELLPLLRRGPLAAAFAPAADLSGITGAPLRVAAVRHRAAISIDEVGTEAAAATAVVTERVLRLDRPQFAPDAPFLLAVRHEASGVLVAAALVADPAEGGR